MKNDMKMLKAMVCLVAFAAVLAGGFTMMTAKKAEAARCCYVMVCTVSQPVVCWEVCKPCPKL